ncbi:hypothetical protein [Actinacidiphila acididurans]|uniref:Uncharacterized protein n=1 Tax=Actinacidiphila acididurans TaxID=2784346 RepID=A0ABS2TXD8_9ACTN|nr:hypothetical protein [Actinacidiphila acididurans]MBM9508008.1 hypothetical protein [Actinacidiphila acididurans]
MPLDAHVNRADAYGTDIDIFPWPDQSIWADTRTGIPPTALELLRLYGFVRVSHPGILDSHELTADLPWPERQLRATRAAESLTISGFRVNLDPALYNEDALPPYLAEARRRQRAAAIRSIPAAEHQAATVTPLPPTAAPTLIRRAQ